MVMKTMQSVDREVTDDLKDGEALRACLWDDSERVVGRIVRVYADGSQTGVWRVETKDLGSVAYESKKDALLALALYAKVLSEDGRGWIMPESPGRHVPVKIARLGKPYIAAYLLAYVGYDPGYVADVLDVSKATVWNYASQVRGGLLDGSGLSGEVKDKHPAIGLDEETDD